jgi:hypothetical protein
MPVTTATRTTVADIRAAERLANRAMALAGSRTRYLAQGRNGYQAVDVYRAATADDVDAEVVRSTGTMRDTLRAGLTRREAVLVLQGMAEAVDVFAYHAVITWPNDDPR